MRLSKLFTFLAVAVFTAACFLLAVPTAPAMPVTLASAASLHDLGLLSFGFAGLVINKANLEEIFRNIKTSFHKAFDAAPSQWEKIAMLVPSTSSENNYKWLSNFPKMRRWVGAKFVKSLEAFKYTIVNDDWEATIEIDRNDIEDDNLGIIGPQAASAGFSAKQLPDEIVGELVNGAFANPCFDGQFFCDTDHPVAGASVSNKLTAALSITTLAAAQASLGAARTAMRLFKDDEGRPLGATPNVLMVGPALEDTARALLTNDRLEDGKPNPYKNSMELVVNPWITSQTAWFVLDTTKAIKPFIYQERKKPVLVSMVDPNSPTVFNLRKFLYSAEARAAGGYGFWQLCVGSTGAG
ncbi:MAG TPA: Mu-like prophage major head subunit gpT family protein [Nevskiales bacterium]|nr:Mu-like prophage major head subunit gpT family protein [Nevskiales bacterium]